MSEARDAAISATRDYDSEEEEYCDVSVIDPLDLEPIDTPYWSSDLPQIPFNIEIVVAWNFTNTSHTKSLVIRNQSDPDNLWIDSSTKDEFIRLTDAKYWIALPELPEE